MPCGERQQRRTGTVAGAEVTTAVDRVERTRVTIGGRATTVEPRIAGIHEVRVRPAPGLSVTEDRLGSSSFISCRTAAGFKGTDIIVV